MKKSKLITFEGIEGSGKTTQIQLLKKSLEDMGLKVHLFREPGGTKLGEKVREILLDADLQIDPLAELMLFISSRVELLKTKIIPLLDQSEPCIVILDRFRDSSKAYQGAGRGLGVDTISKAHQIPPLNIEPDLTIYLDISAEKSHERVVSRQVAKDKMELLDLDFFKTVRTTYIELAAQNENMQIINADQSIQSISKDVLAYVKGII